VAAGVIAARRVIARKHLPIVHRAPIIHRELQFIASTLLRIGGS